MKKISKQATTKKILIPLILLSLTLIFCISTVSAGHDPIPTTIQPTNPISPSTEQSHDTQTTQNTVKPTTSASTAKPTTCTSSTKVSNSNTDQTMPDPQIYCKGVPVDRNGHPVGYVYTSITEAIGDAIDGDTIMLESGAVFNEQLTISKNLTFSVFNNGYATLDGSTFTGSIVTITPGVTVNFNNIIFQNGKANFGGAINNIGTLTINGCTFNGNTATGYGYGGAIENYGALTIKNSKFNKNRAYDGGAISNDGGSVNIQNTIFSDNRATNEGGAIWSDHPLTIKGSAFLRNAAIRGGALDIDASNANISFSRIVGNTATRGAAIFCEDYGYLKAENNWWGSNSNPKTINNLIVTENGIVDANPWLLMEFISDPAIIIPGGTSKLIASFNRNSNGVLVGNANNHIPDGTLVKFTTTLGNVGSKYVFVGTINGVATAILRGDEGVGDAVVSAALDSQRLTSTVFITSTADAAYDTIGMQETGLPIPMVILAIIMVLGGLIGAKRE